MTCLPPERFPDLHHAALTIVGKWKAKMRAGVPSVTTDPICDDIIIIDDSKSLCAYIDSNQTVLPSGQPDRDDTIRTALCFAHFWPDKKGGWGGCDLC